MSNQFPDVPKRRSRARKPLLKLGAILFGLFVGLVLAEVSLRIVEKIQVKARDTPAVVLDPVLGQRMVPNSVGHDANGYRNSTVRPQVDIVAMGDSQTWGVNALGSEAWPLQLEKLSGRTVYNMGVGGYGPVQYWMQADQALTFSPKTIVVGIYFGNDLYDAYTFTYGNERYADLRSKEIADRIKQDTVVADVKRFWEEEKNFHNTYGRSTLVGWDVWLRVHTAVGRLLNRTGAWPGATDVDFKIDKAWANTYPEHGAVCDEPEVRTVLTTAYRLTALNLDEPRIVEGLTITKESLARLQQKVNGRSRLVVLLIPTKESVYGDVMRSAGRTNGTYERLLEMESRARNELQKWCTEKQVQCIDALPALQSALQRHEHIYLTSTESHPSPAGYAVIGAAVQEALKNSGQ